jgi:hypothetical protein
MSTVKSTSNNELPVWFTELSDNTNFTDPKVIHDPELRKPNSLREFNNAEYNASPTSRIDTTQVHGILIPIIDINGIPIPINKLKSMEMNFNKFVPTLKFSISDSDRAFQFNGGLSLNNRVTVIITPPHSGIYRKISVSFYIKEQKNLSNDIIEFECEYYHNGLWKNACEQIGDKALSTYEFCEQISKQLQLGFAATDKCKDIEDKRWRQIYSQRISDFIIEQIKLGGVDEESIFDAWIDPYGYLVLSNISWILNENVNDKDLEMTISSGITSIATEGDKPLSEPKKFKRFISNVTEIPFDETRIILQKNDLYTKNTNNTGTLRNCWILKDIGNGNSLEMQNIQMIEVSVEGVEASSFYESNTTEFLGCEMSEDTPYLYQQEIRKSFLIKQRSRQIIVLLAAPNYGLQRGTLINVMFCETDQDKITKIHAKSDGLFNKTLDLHVAEHIDPNEMYANTQNAIEQLTEVIQSNIGKSINKNVINHSDVMHAGAFAVNTAISGIYYIDGIQFIYNSDEQKIYQYLFLIKKGLQSNLSNSFVGPRI